MEKTVRELITDNLQRIAPYLHQNKIEAYRLVHASPPLPVTVDIYKDNAVLHVSEKISLEELKELEAEIKKLVPVQNFFYKNRTKEEIELPKSPHKEIIVEEYSIKFHINLSDYLDTGLFLDHRETKKWIGAQSKEKSVLNTFAYTGSFSLYAARGGAEKTHSVDLSKTYCEWIKKNLALNNFEPEKNWVFKMDTFEYFKYARRKKLMFDIIIIDPPTFSRNKGTSFSVKNDHPALINGALELLTPKGFILFSNNYTEFHMSKTKLTRCVVEEKFDTIPPDFEGAFPHRCFIIKHA